jgi:TolB protein
MRACQLLLMLAAAIAVRADGPAGNLAFPRDGAIYILDLSTGKGQEIVKGLTHDRPIEWSPDGKQILYWKHGEIGWDLWAVGADGQGARNLTQIEAGGARSGAWSPDASKVAYMRDQPQGLYVVDAGGKNPKRLTHDGFRDQPPAWSPDGKWIVYQEFGFVDESARAEAKFKVELFAVAADGSKKQKIVASEGSSDSASYSPRGDKLLYRGTRGRSGEICTLDIPAGNETVLTKTPAAEEYAPSWSPDGSRIAFWRDTEQAPELWIMKSDGADPKKLASVKTGAKVDRPQWSEGGHWIAFGGTEPADGVWVVSTTQPQPRQVAQGCGAYARWQPATAR